MKMVRHDAVFDYPDSGRGFRTGHQDFGGDVIVL
jgi:hypothetical protein